MVFFLLLCYNKIEVIQVAINNVYNQTPKRIFTNKPFVKGMSYTNADMAPYVCRAVSNLDLESSNTGTHVRQGIENKHIKFSGAKLPVTGNVLKFYNKYLIIPNIVVEDLYKASKVPQIVQNQGLELVSADYNDKYDFYDTIIYNDTSIVFNDGILTHSDHVLGLAKTYNIFVLKLNDGTVPHIINPNDRSLSFFGIIANKQSGVFIYRGLIRVYFHQAANKAILELISPDIVEPSDVLNYGSNILADNPLVYKDHVYFNDRHDGYLEYSMQDSNNVIDITTVQVYDKSVPVVEYSSDSKANLVKGFNKDDADGTVYIRPFPVLPKGNYSAIVSASSVDGSDGGSSFVYNFNNGSFSADPSVEVPGSDSILDKSVSYISGSYSSFNDNGEFSDINLILTSSDVHSTAPKLTGNTGEAEYYSTITNKGLSKFYTSGDVSNMPGGINVDYASDAYTRLVTQLEVNVKPLEFNIDSFAATAANPYKVAPELEVTRHYFFYRAESETGITVPYPIYLDYDMDETSYVTTKVKGVSPQDYADGTFHMYGDYISDEEVWRLVVMDNYNNEVAYTIDSSVSYHQINRCVTILSTVSVNKDNEADRPESANLYYMVDSKYPYASSSYPLTGEEAGISLGYNLYLSGTTVKAEVFIDVDSSKLPYSEIDMLFTKYYPSGSDDPLEFPLITDEMSLDEIKSSYGISENVVNTLDMEFPKLSISEETTKLAITDDYIKHIQQLDSDSVFHADYNLPISKSAVKTISNERGALIFTVTIFPSSEGNVYTAASSVSMPTAIIKTYIDDVVEYSNLSIETNFKSGVNKMAMHLGHYVFWGNGTETNTLYYSEFNNPAYIPSMYAIDFDNPIVHVHPHQGNLVVFTTDDIYLLHSGNVPSTTTTDGSEIAFTQSLIQSNTRLGYDNINTVVSIGKDVFFISDSGDGYLLKTNRYVSNSSDTYLVKITHQIEDLLKNPFEYSVSRGNSIGYTVELAQPEEFSKVEISQFCLSDIDPTLEYNLDAGFKYVIAKPNEITVQDGDTFYHKNITYRMTDINTPELASNARLSNVAKKYLELWIGSQSSNDADIYLFYRPGVTDQYGRTLVWVLRVSETDDDTYEVNYINADILTQGLSDIFMENPHSAQFRIYGTGTDLESYTSADQVIYSSLELAKRYNRGVHNNKLYIDQESSTTGSSTYVYSDTNMFKLYTYATNNYIYIVQSVVLANAKGITIIYKYSIDSRTWTTYDFAGAVFPTEIIPDSSKVGFFMLCENENKNFIKSKFSILTFKNNFVDHNEVAEYSGNIHAYFDTGNQALAIMNEKLFREFKLSIGSSDTDNLDIQYKIKMYVDGIEITDKDKHFKGKQDTANGFKKITFFAPSRGRIPRYTVDITCDSDINILEYAIVYLQLNAK
jgi:hypothetical protein